MRYRPLIIPAIDILGGRSVRLIQGDYERSTIYSDDPVDVARRFASAGAKRLHVVDLDAARGTAGNARIIAAVTGAAGVPVQVAGGIRSEEAADRLIAGGAGWVVLGTLAVTQPDVCQRCAEANPGRVLAALDVRDGRPAVAGWTETVETSLESVVERWNGIPLGGVILTCVDRDGTMSGPDLATLDRVRGMTELELQYSGGIASVADIRRVAEAGADAVILGKALYEGRIRLEEAMAP